MNRIAAMSCAALCFVPLMLAANVYAQLEGSLFTDPDERAYLDYLREEYRRNNAEEGFNIEEVDIPEIPDEVVIAEDTGPAEYSFGGVMTRSNGSHRIWLNGALLAQDQLPEGITLVENNRLVSLRIVQDGRTFVLRPGQAVNVADGAISEIMARVSASAQDDTEALPTTPDAAASEASALSAEAIGEIAAGDATVTTEPETDPVRADDMDSAVGALSEEEATELAAALERRRAASAEAQSEAEEADDEP